LSLEFIVPIVDPDLLPSDSCEATNVGSTDSQFRELVTTHLEGMVSVGQVTLCPDGSMVAFAASRLDTEANTYRRQIWIVPTDGSAPAMPMTSGDPGESDPAWSPDGRYLAFVSRREPANGSSAGPSTGATLHVLPISAPGEVRRVAARPDALSSPVWSPDGKWIAFAARVPHERYPAKDERAQSARRIDTFFTQLNSTETVGSMTAVTICLSSLQTAPAVRVI
jgi:Tol biopolymer transport system component